MVTTVAEQTEERVQSNVTDIRAEASRPDIAPNSEPVVPVVISGEPVRVALVPDTDFRPIDLDTANEYHAAVKVLAEATELTQRLADRLTDPLDGRTTEGVRLLLSNNHEAPPRLIESMQGYLYGVLTSGGTLDPTTGAVLIPPVSRSVFTAAIESMPTFHGNSFDAPAWIEHLYDPRPNIGQGYYRFKSPADWERFSEIVTERNPDVSEAINRLRECFEHASESGTITAADREEYVRLSQKVLAAQEATLEKILDPIPGAFDPLTRVTLELRPGLAPDVVVTPYSTEFKAELVRISGNLLTAENLLPAEAGVLRDVVRSQERWCLTPSSAQGWGEPSEQWIDVASQQAAFDLQFHCAETVSLIGEKRNFQFLITQPLSGRELAALDLEAPQTSFAPGYGAPHISTPYVRLIESGGVARYPVISRDGTIESIASAESAVLDPAQSIEFQKQPILVNVVQLGITHDTGSLREVSPTLVEDLARASILADALKAANRTDSATQYILGVPGELTAHAYAVAGAVGNAATCRSESIQPVLDVLVGYEALLCLKGGTLGVLERSTLGIVQELERRGALSLDVSSGGLRITHIDPIKLRDIARTLQHQLQLWQLGLPLSVQRKIVEAIEALPPDQSLAPAGLTFARNLDQVTRRRLREEARSEVETFFAPDAIAPIVEKLTPLLGTIPPERLTAAPPTDREIHIALAERRSFPLHE